MSWCHARALLGWDTEGKAIYDNSWPDPPNLRKVYDSSQNPGMVWMYAPVQTNLMCRKSPLDVLQRKTVFLEELKRRGCS